ncbi:PLC-like phosphodiesterase [Microstroma glucosiphilum]|uniref:PLC-like phosphodiesterase n=1 Tax=Pseudomicrostroma glucosiphilum TaxID=1684307 RepID=A0A316UIG2_9BASI|nr:PLC-like phosphodiesterase [Pseudomicrostroma glucosiphilum]PWN22995.1 PLC-like phosphodiesterase [Pseudomicrostroma glucosiphilum]
MQGTPRLEKTDGSFPPLQLLLLPNRDKDNFMSLLPDSVCLSALSIPGTHETFARYGWPIAQCQEVTSTIRAQLEDGIRFMDFRVTPKGRKGKERLLAYHGLTAERIELGAALQQVYDFLKDERSRRETVIISIKQEKGDRQLMKRLLFDLYVRPNEDKWFLSPKIPTLGEARGKIVMFSRFGESNEDRVGGIHPPIWPNNEKGVWEYTLPLSGQKVKTQDWFNIGSSSNIPVKFDLASQLLDEAGADPDVFALDFISGATFPRATPPVVAKGWWETGPKCIGIEGMNRRMVDLIAGKLMQTSGESEKEHVQGARRTAAQPGLQACYAIDFYGYENAASLIPLLIEANFTEEMVAARRAEDKAIECV